MTSVGVIGAGRMGLPIIGHLARRGFSVVASDLDGRKQAAVEAAGARWVGAAATLAAGAEVILVCVGYDREVRELLGVGGALRQAPAGAIVAILSTVTPKSVQELAKEAAAAGLHVIDSTVCRGGDAADAGTLLSFVGGPAEVVERITPVLRAYSSDVVHTGAVGSAQVAKAVNNLILWACLVADHEGLALAQAHGLDPEVLRQALMTSSCTNGPLDRWGLQSMAWAEDDMAIVSEMAEQAGIGLPLCGVVREVCRPLRPRRYKLAQYGR
jgi:3-hydroxyisobutyrate dehydrogenase-like beta-hydroxyacid dehydrogenase